jgi:peptide deformylase
VVLKVNTYPDTILRKKAVPVDKISKEIFKLADDMVETMLKEDGLGLAANQVGSLLRIFVLNATPHEDKPTPVVMINPEVLSQEGSVTVEEGCLSFPGLYLTIVRPERVRVHARDLYNEDFVYEMDGVLARAVLHEVDHLNGTLIIDHVDTSEQDKVKDYVDGLHCKKTDT